jgi:hypothetical protein
MIMINNNNNDNNNNNNNSEINLLITKYLDQLTDDEKIVLKIAKEQLQSSFSIEKSIGFLEWKEK